MSTLSSALALLDELRQRAGLDELLFAPDRYSSIVFGDLLVSVQIPEENEQLRLLAAVEVPSWSKEAVLRKAEAVNAKQDEAGFVVGYDERQGALSVSGTVATNGMSYPEFERKLTDFVEICEALRNGDQTTPTTPPPMGAVFV